MNIILAENNKNGVNPSPAGDELDKNPNSDTKLEIEEGNMEKSGTEDLNAT